jgi:hypothetical protein
MALSRANVALFAVAASAVRRKRTLASSRKADLANFREGSKTDIGSHANEKTCFQSVFMLITVQPSFVASS